MSHPDVFMDLLNDPSRYDEQVFIGLGSNLGDKRHNINRAVDFLKKHDQIKLTDVTELVETAPWGNREQPSFINAIAVVYTRLSPLTLLSVLQYGERLLGRLEAEERWGPRVIDLDILLFGTRIVKTKDLTVPHAQILNRRFILSQLVELEDALFIPGTKDKYSDYL